MYDNARGVLVNKFNIHESRKLEKLERYFTGQRWHSAPIVPLTADGYCALHRHLFQDIYHWAGQYRTVDISKRELFDFPDFISRHMESAFKDLSHTAAEWEHENGAEMGAAL